MSTWLKPIHAFNELFLGNVPYACDIAYHHGWANDTGYLDHAVNADLGLKCGQVARATDHLGRRIVIIGMPEDMGNAVFFERYADKRETVIAMHLPRGVSAWFDTPNDLRLDKGEDAELFLNVAKNVGTRIADALADGSAKREAFHSVKAWKERAARLEAELV